MARKELLTRRNTTPNCTQDFSEGIQEYLRTRKRAASMTSLFGSLENMEQQKVKSFRSRAKTLSHILAQKTRTARKDEEIGLSEKIFKRQENMLKKIKLSETKDNQKESTHKNRKGWLKLKFSLQFVTSMKEKLRGSSATARGI